MPNIYFERSIPPRVVGPYPSRLQQSPSMPSIGRISPNSDRVPCRLIENCGDLLERPNPLSRLSSGVYNTFNPVNTRNDAQIQVDEESSQLQALPAPINFQQPQKANLSSRDLTALDPAGEIGPDTFQSLTPSLPVSPADPPPSLATLQEWVTSLLFWRRSTPCRIRDEDLRITGSRAEQLPTSGRDLDNIHRGPWFEIHQNFVLYVLRTVGLFDRWAVSV
ncbi:hypothetical protein B0H14DRAFT_543590 [Mycena olivaceomarginata]|nr:hypothetical protein B0H14DRAFT_543590 [Mycena olivaceomarginata]